jgi:hypothetical protein
VRKTKTGTLHAGEENEAREYAAANLCMAHASDSGKEVIRSDLFFFLREARVIFGG